MHPPFLLRSAALRAACLSLLGAPLAALSQTAAESPGDAPPEATLPAVVVTGRPLGSDGLVTPGSVLAGPGLVLRRGSSLGDTLSGVPGVSSTYFGPNANRPVIRGQDGDRIRVLDNAGASLDASALSFDHAVPIDPLVVERLEVLRGPAALLYGGSAVGGVVNAIDNRIPKAAVDGVGGALELRGAGAASERSASGLVEAGGNGLAIHADAFARRTDDLRVPDFERPLAGGGSERRDRIVNSASDARGGALGAAMTWDHGYLGASVDTYRNDYGIVAEDDVTIRMRRDKLALAGEWRDLDGPLRSVRFRVQDSDYVHREVEGDGTVGTTFRNRGSDARVELEHAPLGAVKGVVGLQAEHTRFEALGEEAFVPSTTSRQLALFALEELKLQGASRLSFGARVERHRIDSAGDADPAEPRFGDPQQRRFTARSAALGSVWDLAGLIGSGWHLDGNLAYTERAPTSYELYANGVHLATAAFERGDASLGTERGRQLDLALAWSSGHDRLRAGVFVSDFSHYIALLRTGEPDVVGDGGETFPVYAFTDVRARLEGVELEGAWRAWSGPRTLDLDAQLDAVRATDRTSGEPLPRIAPLRLRLGAEFATAGWMLRGEVVGVARQDRVPSDDTPTAGYALLNVSLSKRTDWGGSNALWFVRLDNATDRLAYNAASVATVRSLAPLPGRSLSAGLRVAF